MPSTTVVLSFTEQECVIIAIVVLLLFILWTLLLNGFIDSATKEKDKALRTLQHMLQMPKKEVVELIEMPMDMLKVEYCKMGAVIVSYWNTIEKEKPCSGRESTSIKSINRTQK